MLFTAILRKERGEGKCRPQCLGMSILFRIESSRLLYGDFCLLTRNVGHLIIFANSWAPQAPNGFGWERLESTERQPKARKINNGIAISSPARLQDFSAVLEFRATNIANGN